MLISHSHDSYGTIFSPFHDNEHSSRTLENQKKFISIDGKGHLSLTDKQSSGSSLKRIHHFIKLHSSECTQDQIDLLTSYTDDLDRELHSHGVVYRKIHSLDSFLLNLGKTDETLISEMHKEIEYQKLKIEMNRILDTELGELIRSIIQIKAGVTLKLDEKPHLSKPCLRRELSCEIEKLNKELVRLQQLIHAKEYRKQINVLLKKIKISENDLPFIKEAKRQIALEYKDIIGVMTFSHVQFGNEYHLKVFIDLEDEESDRLIELNEYVNFSDAKKTSHFKKSVEVEISSFDKSEMEEEPLPSNYSRMKHIETCNLRDSLNELTVNKTFDVFLEMEAKKSKKIQHQTVVNKVDRKSVIHKVKQKVELSDGIDKDIHHQTIIREFTQNVEQNELKEKLLELIALQADLKEKEDQREALASINGKSLEIQEIKKNINEKMNVLKTKEYQKQIKVVLKQVKIFEENSHSLKEAKNQVREENLDLIKILEDVQAHIQFAEIVEVNVFDKIEGSIDRLLFATNFSDRFHHGEIKGYYSRSPSDFSLNRDLQKVVKLRKRNFVFISSEKSRNIDPNLLLNTREKAISLSK